MTQIQFDSIDFSRFSQKICTARDVRTHIVYAIRTITYFLDFIFKCHRIHSNGKGEEEEERKNDDDTQKNALKAYFEIYL